MDSKEKIRKQILEQRKKEDADVRWKQSLQIIEQIQQYAPYQSAKTIFCYCATVQEIQTMPILEQALQQGKQVCIPRCEQAGWMSARHIRTLATLQVGAYGILEPPANSHIIQPEQIDLCLIPCLCADFAGYRLGYGGGYYDRFLQKATNTHKVILCTEQYFWKEQRLPTEYTDVAGDAILTERQVYFACEK